MAKKVASASNVHAGEVDEESEGFHSRDSIGHADPNDVSLPSPSSSPRASFPGRDAPALQQQQQNDDKQKDSLKHNPQLFDSARAPRCPVVLCHGLYGFDVRGPESFPKLRMHYWSDVLSVLKKVGAEVVVTGVPGTASISARAERMDRFLQEKVKGRDINFIAHSMGGLDCRHLITHIRPTEYRTLSLTSLSVPHRGSPFMDWCMANIGIGSPRPFPLPSSFSSSQHTSHAQGTQPPPPTPSSKHTLKRAIPYSLSAPLLSHPTNDTQSTVSSASSPIPPSQTSSPDASASASNLRARLNLSILQSLPSSVTSLILSLIDSPAYSNLTTGFLRDIFNPYTPDDPNVKYFSIAAHIHKMSIWHPLWIPKMIVDAAEELESGQEGEESVSGYHGSSNEMTLSHPNSTGTYRRRAPRKGSATYATLTQSVLKGNDGLVPISSAKWGTFLGVVEGCNHWDIRGTGGFGPWSVASASEVRGTAGNGSEGEKDRNAEGDKERGGRMGLSRFDWDEGWRVWSDWIGAVSRSGSGESGAGNGVNQEKSNTQIQTQTQAQDSRSYSDSLAFPTHDNRDLSKPASSSHAHDHTLSWTALNGFSEGRRFDLERFYVALCRKLYDEGL